jgi:hypothetical protein
MTFYNLRQNTKMRKNGGITTTPLRKSKVILGQLWREKETANGQS